MDIHAHVHMFPTHKAWAISIKLHECKHMHLPCRHHTTHTAYTHMPARSHVCTHAATQEKIAHGQDAPEDTAGQDRTAKQICRTGTGWTDKLQILQMYFCMKEFLFVKCCILYTASYCIQFHTKLSHLAFCVCLCNVVPYCPCPLDLLVG